MDTDPSTFDNLRFRSKMFDPDFMIAGNEDTADNYIKGHYTIGKDLVDHSLETMRRLVE